MPPFILFHIMEDKFIKYLVVRTKSLNNNVYVISIREFNPSNYVSDGKFCGNKCKGLDLNKIECSEDKSCKLCNLIKLSENQYISEVKSINLYIFENFCKDTCIYDGKYNSLENKIDCNVSNELDCPIWKLTDLVFSNYVTV